MSDRRLCFAALLLCLLHSCAASCYFPIELQGEYAMQSTSATPGGQVQYSQVNITADAILPIWGHCHRRLGNSVILTDSLWGPNCSRCFHITLRSRNVLQVRTEGLDKCYTNEEAAEATCPDEKTAQFKDIILYKTKDLGGEEIKRVYCPFNGRFSFIYNVNDGSESTTECPDPVSELDNCPSGSALNLRFRRCSFENRDVTFQCLGQWAGPGDQHYLALRDTRPEMNRFPPYRCALYREESGTGNVFMAFSSDSTCISNLRSATAGYETLSLSVMPAQRWPPDVDGSNCRFPQWAHGYWQHIYIEGNTLTYKDHVTFKTFTIRCVGSDLGTGERFPVFARTQCGEEMYTCIWLKRRGVNVLEFQLGLQSSTYYNFTLCSDSNFEPKIWITQGKLERLQESPCPVVGEYTGVIPDATNLCAKLSSDCKSPEIMYYMVSDCSQSEIYEGARRRGRKRRQTGTRIYRISNPRTSTTPLPTFSHFPPNQSNNETDLRDSGRIQQGQPGSHASKYSGPHDDQRSRGTQYDTGRERLDYSYYKSPSPRFPTSYQIGGSSTTFNPLDSQDKFLEEEYDPWTFSKTHGHQADNRTVLKPHVHEYDFHQPGRNINPAWSSENYYGTSMGFQLEPGRKQQDQTYEPNSQRNRHATSMEQNPAIFRNENLQGNQRTSGSFPGQDDQRTGGGYYGPHINQAIAYGNSSHVTQRTVGSHVGSNSDLGSRYNENLPVTHSTVGNSPGSTGNWGLPYSENSQFTQSTVTKYSGSDKGQDFSHNEHRSPGGYPESSRGQGYSYNEYRSPYGYTGSNRDHSIAHNENLQITERNGGSYKDHLVPQIFSNSKEPRTYITHGTSTESYVNHGATPNIHGSYGDTQNAGKHMFHTRDHNHGTIFLNPGLDQKTYSSRVTEVRGQESSVNGRSHGQNHAIPHDRASTNHWEERSLSHTQWNTNVNSQPFKETVSQQREWERPRSIPQSDPVQLLPMPVQRPRYGDRPSAVPRTATPFKQEEREYRCLGQWEEDGLTYTYTQRRDVGTYECFVGSIISNNEIYIKEAGDHCQRNIDPMHYGMKLTRKGTCFGSQSNAGANPGAGAFPQPRPTSTWMSSRHPPEPTKPWKPITAPPRDTSGADGHQNSASIMLLSVLLVIFVHSCQH